MSDSVDRRTPSQAPDPSAALAAAGDLAYAWNSETDRIVWTGAPASVFGAAAAGTGASGDGYHRLINPEDLPRRISDLSRCFAEGGAFRCEYRVRRADGGFGWVQDHGRVELGPSGRPVAMQGVLRNVTHRREVESLLDHRANFDPLTGLLNGPRLKEMLHSSLDGTREGLCGGFIIIGIDELTAINDTYGAATGDSVIAAIAERLHSCTRQGDTLGRIAGDRFGLIVALKSPGDLDRVADRVLRAMRESAVTVAGGQVQISVSIGGETYRDTSVSAADIMARAESAMRDAKQRGRDCFIAYQASQARQRARQDRIAIAERVQKAQSEGRLVFAYQPIVEYHTGRVLYNECLLRMQEPDGRLISAGEFIPALEQQGLMRHMDRYVLNLALDELRRNPTIEIGINISGVTTGDRDWLELLMREFSGHADLARRLTIEITETMALNDINETARFALKLRELGCRVALDDFGAGFNSFRHIRALDVDLIKIDGSYVRNVAGNPNHQLFIKSLQHLADSFNLQTVAECVETVRDAEMLTRLGVQFLQGYYFGKPGAAQINEVQPLFLAAR